MITKVVKIPVRILDESDEIRTIKYKALDEILYESRYLANKGVQFLAALKLKKADGERLIPFVVNEKTGKYMSTSGRLYSMLTPMRKHLPSQALSAMCRFYVEKEYKIAMKNGVNIGERHLPAFKSMFVPIHAHGTEIVASEDGQFVIYPEGFQSAKWLSDSLIDEVSEIKEDSKDSVDIPRESRPLAFVSTFSWKDKGSRAIVSRVISGEYSLCDSQIAKNPDAPKGKQWFVLISYKFNPVQQKLDPNRVCGVDMGVSTPAVCAVNFGPQRAYLGQGSDVLAARAKFRARRRSSQRRKGLRSKSVQWKPSKEEQNFIDTYYHLISRRIIQFCIQHGCGTLHLEDLDELRRENLKSEFKRLMWVPHKLRDFITYKAHEAGIKVVIINPLNSSQRCSICGHISENNRRKRDKWCVFVCEVCGKHDQDGNRKRPVNADYNAAKNIALATGDIITEGYKIPGEEEADSPSPGKIRDRKRQKPMTAISAAGSTAEG